MQQTITRKNALLLTAAATLALLAGVCPAQAAGLSVVATTPELAAIAREVGGSRVSVVSLAKPDQDYHRVEAKPTDVVRVKNAQVFVRVGLDMDMWADSVLNAARNPGVQAGGKGYVDAGRLIKRLEVPSTNITGASGDVHVYGNPHYWLDPGNAKVIAYEIDLALRAVDPAGEATYDGNYKRFSSEIDQNLVRWKQALAPFSGKPVVAYHDEWVYFYQRFGLRAFGYLEPKPGIPPSGAHVQNLVSQMKSGGVKAVVIPSIYPLNFPNLIGREASANVVVVPYSVGSQGTSDYISYMSAIVSGFQKALR